MSAFKQRTLDFLSKEWGTYVERYNRWERSIVEKRVKQQGYERFRDMLAHVLAWWEEGMPIISAIAENREYPRKKYDYDAFNAEAVEKYRDWDEEKFLAYFEEARQKAEADLKSMNEAAFENIRVQRWINGIFIHHAREHLVALSRFLALDTLENEWAAYPQKLNAIEDKKAFLEKQGVESVHDMLVHVFGWWDAGAKAINGTWHEPDTDAHNRELTESYRHLSDEEVLKMYEAKRIEMIALVKSLPEESFYDDHIERWLAADVVEHYDEHA